MRTYYEQRFLLNGHESKKITVALQKLGENVSFNHLRSISNTLVSFAKYLY